MGRGGVKRNREGGYVCKDEGMRPSEGEARVIILTFCSISES